MRIFRKMLSVFMAAVMIVSAMCVGTVSAGAEELDKPSIDLFEISGTTYLIFRMPAADLLEIYTESAKKEKTTFSVEIRIAKYKFYFNALESNYYYEIENSDGDTVSYDDFTSSLYRDGWQLTFDSGSAMAKAVNSASTISYNYYIKTQSGDYLYGDSKTHIKYILSGEKDISSLEISDLKSYTYTGKNRKAAVTIKDGDYTLKKGTDYTLTYKNCKNIGTASVTIKGKGNYTGSKTLTYKIVPKKTTLKAAKKSDTKVKLSWTAVDGAEKYQIYYSTNGGKYKKLTTVSGSKTSVTISKLDFEKNDYKFKIRSYAVDDDTKYYSSYSNAVTVK